jgi:hypothetical protein
MIISTAPNNVTAKPSANQMGPFVGSNPDLPIIATPMPNHHSPRPVHRRILLLSCAASRSDSCQSDEPPLIHSNATYPSLVRIRIAVSPMPNASRRKSPRPFDASIISLDRSRDDSTTVPIVRANISLYWVSSYQHTNLAASYSWS